MDIRKIAAALGTLTFASNSLSISLVFIPMISQLPASEQRGAFRIMFNRMTIIQTILGSIGVVFSYRSWLSTGHRAWAATVGFGCGILVWTAAVMAPIVYRPLVDLNIKLSPDEVAATVTKWNSFHWARIGLALLASVSAVTALVVPKHK